MRFLFTFAGGEGHVQPLLPLARAAAAAGHVVAVSGAPSLAPVAQSEGLSFIASGPDVAPRRVPLRPVDLEHEYRVLRDSFASWHARARAVDLLPLCARWRPDVVVRDEADFGAAVAAERAGVAHAAVLVIAAGSFMRAAGVAEPLNRLRAEHGLSPDPDAAMLSRHLVLSPFAPSFRDPADPLPDTAHSFRPTVESAVAERTDGRPLVYVTLGTIFNTESGDLLARVVQGVRELPVEVVVTVGRSMDPAELGPQPQHVRVERYVPQSSLLPRCAAAVTHAGSGSVAGALQHGVPLVCIPIGADQPLNAARCTALGVGVALDAVALTPDEARAATSEVLTAPRYRAAAERLRAEVASQPPVEHAVALLERLG